MRRQLFLLFLICSAIVVNGQDYIPYFHKITDAENQIRRGEFSTALQTYDSLFKSYPNVSYKNIHNACLCALKVEDSSTAFKYAKQLVLKGYERNDFEQQEFDGLRNRTNEWNSFVGEYDKLRNEYLSRLNKIERNYYYQKHLEDQKGASSFDIPVQDTVFFKLASELSHHIEVNGFPNWFLSKDTLSHKVQVMFRHYCGLYNRIKNDEQLQEDPTYANRARDLIKPIVHKALKEGLLTPQLFECIVSYHDGNPYGELAVKIDVDNEQVYPFLLVKQGELNEINTKRSAIGLPPIENNSAEYLNGTWLSAYPFDEVRKAVENCDTCTTFKDYQRVKVKIECKLAKKYESADLFQGFLLVDYMHVNNKYYHYQFMKDLLRKGVKN